MADNTKIEWADATVSEGCGPARRMQPDVIERHTVDGLIFDFAACGFQPLPKIAVAFRRIARAASGDNIVWLGQASLADRHHMIPGRGKCVAVRAKAFEIVDDAQCKFGGHRINFSASRHAVADRPLAVPGIGRVAPPRYFILARPAHALLRHRGTWEPLLAAAAPAQTRRPHGLANKFSGTSRSPIALTFPTDIRSPVEARSVGGERLEPEVSLTFRASLLTVRSAPNVARIRGASIFGGSHA